MKIALSLGRRGVAAAAGASAAGLAAILVVAGCSAASGSKTASSTSGSAASSSSASATSSNRAADFGAYTQCLSQHGVAVPTFSGRPDFGGRPGSSGRPVFSPRPRPSGGFVRPSGAPRSGGPGGRFGFLGSADPSTRAAMQACQSLAPQGGFGFGGGGGATISAATFGAFKSCMSDNGVTIAATDPQQALRSLDRSDPKTTAALKVCQPIIGRPTASPSPTG